MFVTTEKSFVKGENNFVMDENNFVMNKSNFVMAGVGHRTIQSRGFNSRRGRLIFFILFYPNWTS